MGAGPARVEAQVDDPALVVGRQLPRRQRLGRERKDLAEPEPQVMGEGGGDLGLVLDQQDGDGAAGEVRARRGKEPAPVPLPGAPATEPFRVVLPPAERLGVWWAWSFVPRALTLVWWGRQQTDGA